MQRFLTIFFGFSAVFLGILVFSLQQENDLQFDRLASLQQEYEIQLEEKDLRIAQLEQSAAGDW